jgi:adenosine deaminase
MRRISSLRPLLMHVSRSLAFLLLCALVLQAQSASSREGTPEQRAASFFESVRKSPPQQLAFLLRMPKGADLHSHLSGSVYAERYLEWAAEKKLCVNQTTMALSEAPCVTAAGQLPASQALTDDGLYRRMINAWSMRYWQFSGQNGHDQFFDTFGKFGAATWNQTGQMLADAAKRAARGRVSYLELMLTPDGGASGKIGDKLGWDGNFEGMLNKLKSDEMAKAAQAAIRALQDAEAKKDETLKCGTPQADPGCLVTIRYIAQVARGGSPGSVFAQMVMGFTLASDPNSKVVALNLVQAEDGLVAMRDFPLHMEMLGRLRPLYPNARLTLHAGELAPGIVPPEGLTFHIRDSVMKAGADRIGHGVDIMHEDEPYELLKEMARRGVLVEVCLTSNDVILGIAREHHPLATYMQYGVPVALATDDEGVSRSEISREFLKAAEEHGLSYRQLKTMARNSLEYAFLPGASLWSDAKKFAPVPQCSKDVQGLKLVSDACRQYIESSEKARLQWKLEEDFKAFESRY